VKAYIFSPIGLGKSCHHLCGVPQFGERKRGEGMDNNKYVVKK
jgi:hypothetical protein